MVKKIFLILIILTSLILLKIIRDNPKQDKICFENHCFYVELARTEQERTYGLMFRESMDLNKGMLFIFNEEKEYPFWMKNTLFSLDIIWINQDKEIVFIKKNVQPCKEEKCERIDPDKKAKYVLEINGGITDSIGVGLGDRLTFRLK